MKYSLEIKDKKAIETLEFNGKRYSKQYKEIDTSAVVTYDEDLSEQLAHNDEDDDVLDVVYETLEKGNLLNDLFDLAAYEKETGLVVDCRNYDNNRRYKCQAYTENHDACENCECNLARKAKDTPRPTANLVVAGPAKAGHVYASCSICNRAWLFSERSTKKSLHAHMLEETPYCNCGAKFVGVIEKH